MLTVKDLSTITLELMLNRAPTNTSEEATNARTKIAEDLAEMAKKGIMLVLPDDFEG